MKPANIVPECAGAALVCMAFVLLVMVGCSGCTSQPARWEHFVDPWPVEMPVHPEQPMLCEDFCQL